MWQKLSSEECKRLLSFIFKNFFLLYMRLILHVSMLIRFFVFYDFLHLVACLFFHISCVIVQGVSCQTIHIYCFIKGQSHVMEF